MTVDLKSRWMPPSPHREKLIEELETGRLTVRERGHGLAPAVVHEDGGHIDLPDIRWNGSRWTGTASGSTGSRQTAYSDVCGCSYEARDRIAEDSPLTEEDVARIRELEDDVEYMVGRMDRRLGKYYEFAARLESIAAQMKGFASPDADEARKSFEAARAILAPGNMGSDVRSRLLELTENARLVAQAQEDTMKEHKELAIEALLAFDDLRGARNWDVAVEAMRTANGSNAADDAAAS